MNLVRDRLKVLRTMTEVTGKIGLKEFTELSGLTLGQTLGYLQGFTKAGFVRKVGPRYSITQEGKVALKAVTPVPEGKEFHFYTEIDQYTGVSAKSFTEFLELVKTVNVIALEFHTARRDFERWITTIFDDTQLGNEFRRIRKLEVKDENLRQELMSATENRYNKFKKLMSS